MPSSKSMNAKHVAVNKEEVISILADISFHCHEVIFRSDVIKLTWMILQIHSSPHNS